LRDHYVITLDHSYEAAKFESRRADVLAGVFSFGGDGHDERIASVSSLGRLRPLDKDGTVDGSEAKAAPGPLFDKLDVMTAQSTAKS
jgi:hypothetical protein